MSIKKIPHKIKCHYNLLPIIKNKKYITAYYCMFPIGLVAPHTDSSLEIFLILTVKINSQCIITYIASIVLFPVLRIIVFHKLTIFYLSPILPHLN